MLAKRIIPCLDVKDGRTVKGTRFENLRDAGCPVELAGTYCDNEANELVFIDITATYEKRRGAAPHESIDPILAAAHIVTALQSIVSRNVDPQESVVVTVGQITAGTTFNVIPDHAILKGTVRSDNNEIHHTIYGRILEMARNVSTAFRCSANMETVAIVPAVVNAVEPDRSGERGRPPDRR